MMTYPKEDEMELWTELEEMGLIDKDVKILPECAMYIGKDHHGYELWKGKKYTYRIVKD